VSWLALCKKGCWEFFTSKANLLEDNKKNLDQFGYFEDDF
jgi:hypothetical protein